MYKLIQGSSIGVIVSINTYLHIYLKHSILIIHFNVVYLHRTSNVSADEIGFSRLICRTIFSASQRNTRSFSNRVALKISSDWVWKVPSLFSSYEKNIANKLSTSILQHNFYRFRPNFSYFIFARAYYGGCIIPSKIYCRSSAVNL